jgi:hypothetical protein
MLQLIIIVIEGGNKSSHLIQNPLLFVTPAPHTSQYVANSLHRSRPNNLTAGGVIVPRLPTVCKTGSSEMWVQFAAFSPHGRSKHNSHPLESVLNYLVMQVTGQQMK